MKAAGTLINKFNSTWMLLDKAYPEYGERVGIEYWRVYCVETADQKIFGFRNGIVIYKGRV